MIVRRSILPVLCLMLAVGPALTAPQKGKKEDAAYAAVLHWLALVDGEDYLQCWKDSGEVFRNHLSEEQWIHTMQRERKGFGAIVSRNLKRRDARTTLPGASEGVYVVFRFETTFENRKALMRETIAAALEEDGKWRVIGYYIR